MYISVILALPTGSRNPNSREEPSPQEAPKNHIDMKVREFVLDRLGGSKGGLLLSANDLQMIIDLFPLLDKEESSGKKKRASHRTIPRSKGIPIGLRPIEPDGWINALMQFILFIPNFADHFLFAPRSLDCFQEFIDQYTRDQEEKQPITSADVKKILSYLKTKWPYLTPNQIFHFLIRELHPKWELRKTLEGTFLKGFPSDLFVMESNSKRQVFSDLFCYDLDAFIELRPDGSHSHFIAYVKAEGSWYQCDNERITLLRSNNLTVPLQRTILLHYRRIAFGKNNLDSDYY